MRKRILIAPDKFKGTMDAAAAARAIARGWRSVRSGDELTLLPMSDGGDGFGVKTVDAARRPCESAWWFDPKTRTAVIESARTNGLAMLPAGQFHPFHLDTTGLAAVLRAAERAGAKRCIVGVGGSATNDAGFGLARALGWKFLSRSGEELASWTALSGLAKVVAPPKAKLFSKLVVATDVTNPLLGGEGCSRIYGPQKGLRAEDMPVAEAALKKLAKVMKLAGRDFSKEAGAGAAGGLGFALMAFCGAERESGFEVFSKLAKLPQLIRRADLVVTGEGRIDDQTRMGKGVGELALMCRKLKKPCIGLAGVVLEAKQGEDVFAKTDALVRLIDPETAKAEAPFWLAKLATEAAKELGQCL
jgi:glycerate 2-kinase